MLRFSVRYFQRLREAYSGSVRICYSKSGPGGVEKEVPVPVVAALLATVTGKTTKSQPQGVAFSTMSSNSSTASSPRTPRPLSEEVKSARDRFLNMPLDAKRSQYSCGDNVVTLSGVLKWADYFTKEKVAPVTMGGKKEVNPEINSKVSLWQGDITALEIDSIVNAANKSLLGGGGVDGAIHRAAGPLLLNECRELRGCPQGDAKITGGYKLPAKYVIHTVGPQEELPAPLRSCYLNSLQQMLDNELKSIAFPCIATGIYGYPRDKAADVALSTTRRFLEDNADKVDRVIFTVFLEEDKEVYEELMQKYFPVQ